MSRRDLNLTEAEAEFPDEMDELAGDYHVSSPLDSEETIYVNDGVLHYEYPPDRLFLMFGNGRWHDDAESLELWIEGYCDGLAALRTTDQGWRDE